MTSRNHGESDYASCLDYIGDFYDNFILLCNKLSADPNAIKDLKTLDSFFIQMCNTFEIAYLGASASVQELSDDLIQ